MGRRNSKVRVVSWSLRNSKVQVVSWSLRNSKVQVVSSFLRNSKVRVVSGFLRNSKVQVVSWSLRNSKVQMVSGFLRKSSAFSWVVAVGFTAPSIHSMDVAVSGGIFSVFSIVYQLVLASITSRATPLTIWRCAHSGARACLNDRFLRDPAHLTA